MRNVKLLSPALIAFVSVAIALTSLQLATKLTYAQSPDDIDVVKVLNQQSPLVKVGQYISFTIFVTNTSSFSLIHASLFDDFREDILGDFSAINGSPDPTTIDTANGELTWTDLISAPAAPGFFPELGPNEGISVTVQFQVQHPPVGGFTIVNRAQIRDAVFFGGGGGNTGVISAPTVPITGGSMPINKDLNPLNQAPELGDRVTYTIQLTNDGAAAITETVVVDTFNPNYLSFITATPTLPTSIDNLNGVITWTNLASPPIQPGQVISVAVIFEVIAADVEIGNRAELVSAQDFFGNDLAPGFGEAGILIIEDTPQDTPMVGDDNDDDDDDDDDSSIPAPAPTPTAIPTATPAPTAVASQEVVSGPTTLPETGQRPHRPNFVPLTGLILLTGLIYFLKMRKSIGKE